MITIEEVNQMNVHIDDKDRLVFEKRKPRQIKPKIGVIRVSPEAYAILAEWEAKTGASLSFIASEFIKYADTRAVIDE